MDTNSNIQIIEKPDWVSWDDIKQCLYEAHSVNRAKGVMMSKYLWPTERIIDFIGPNGVMFVALDNTKVVGTGAICDKVGKKWYAKGRYADFSLGSVLPQYSGQGIFKELERVREEACARMNYPVIVGDTHSKNTRRIKIYAAAGYKHVGYHPCSDHFNVVMAKWPGGCPYSDTYIKFRRMLSYIYGHCFKVAYILGKPILNIIRRTK